MVDTDAFRSITLLHSEDCVGGAWWNHTLYDKRNIVFCCMCDIYTRSKTWKYSRINYKLLFRGTLSGDIERFLVSNGIMVIGYYPTGDYALALRIFISDWDLCIAWIMCICVLYKSLCILCDAISCLQELEVYIGGFMYVVVCIYTVWNENVLADGGLTSVPCSESRCIRSAWISLLPRDEMEGDQWIA